MPSHGLKNTVLEPFRQGPELYTLPLWYTMSVLFLFPNIKILVLQNVASWLGNHAGSKSIYESFPGDCYLQNLEELYVTLKDMDDDDCTLSAVAPFLLLPRLKKLVFDQLLGYEWHTRDPVPFDWPYDDKNSGLQELICSTTEVEEDQVGCLLRHLPILRTFVWEDNTSFWTALESTGPLDDGTSRLFDQHGGHQENFGHGKSASFKLRHDL